MSERERFEKWISAFPREGRLDRFTGRGPRNGEYMENRTYTAWEAWCEALGIPETERNVA